MHFRYNLVTNIRARKPLLSGVFHLNTQNKLVVSLNLLKHMGSLLNYSVLVLMFHKVSYEGEFSMLRKGPQVHFPGWTVPVYLPRAQDSRSATWPCRRSTTAGPIFSSWQLCPAISVPRRLLVPSTRAVLVTCVAAPLLPGVVGEAMAARPCHCPPGRCYSLHHSSL